MGSKKRNSVPANPEASRSPKRWNSEFFKNRHKLGKIHDRPFIEFLKDLQVQRSTLDAFLQNSEISGNSWEVEQVRKFFRVSQSFPEARVWVEDRSKTNEYGNATSSKWLNSKELEQALSSKRLDLALLRSGNRHLIFVPYLAPNVIESLIETTTRNEVDALRPAVCQHIAGKSLIRVHVPVSGFSTYQLILNVPYLVLEDKGNATSEPASPLESQTRVVWEELSYLTLESSTGQSSRDYAIYKSRTTVVVSGCDNWTWHGYAFGKIGFSDLEDEDDCPWEEDFFATGGCDPELLNPEDHIWDPRTYFLRATHIRMDFVSSQYEYLVRKIEAGAKHWLSRIPKDHEDHQETLERITGIINLFQALRKHLSQAIRAWYRFNSTDGDIVYFADIRSSRVAREALSSIQKSFELIIDLEHDLSLLETTCEASAKILGLRLTQENNHLSRENNVMNRTMTKINLDASGHSERAARSAARSTTAAEETSRATRVNIQLFVLSTALVIALQYFCSDRALFAFERTPRAFWISIGILMPSLTIVCLALHIIDHYKTVFVMKMQKMTMERLKPATHPDACAV